MRRFWSVWCGLGLLCAALGCSKTIQCTSGICDCDPPPVHSVLQSPYSSVGYTAPVVTPVPLKPQALPAPAGNAGAFNGGGANVPAPVPVMPQAEPGH